MKHEDLITWEETYGIPLYIGSIVMVKPTCKYYEPEADRFTDYAVVIMYADKGGLNIGLAIGDSVLCELDGYYVADLKPASRGE